MNKLIEHLKTKLSASPILTPPAKKIVVEKQQTNKINLNKTNPSKDKKKQRAKIYLGIFQTSYSRKISSIFAT